MGGEGGNKGEGGLSLGVRAAAAIERELEPIPDPDARSVDDTRRTFEVCSAKYASSSSFDIRSNLVSTIAISPPVKLSNAFLAAFEGKRGRAEEGFKAAQGEFGVDEEWDER